VTLFGCSLLLYSRPAYTGDFAILLESGWSVKAALGANFLSSLTAFIGLFIGVAGSDTEDSQQWMLALAAGMFLYIAMTTIVREHAAVAAAAAVCLLACTPLRSCP
jgi:zinc transporter ZupT